MEGDRLHKLIVSALFNLIDNNKATHPVLKLMLSEYETLSEYIEAKNDIESMSPSEKDMLLELFDDIEYYVDTEFSDAEDDCISELMSERWKTRIKAEMVRRGAITEETQLCEDNIEECFVEAFRDFDVLHKQTMELALTLNPKTLFEEAEEDNRAYRERHHIQFDESDFIEAYTDAFSKEGLYRLWKDRLMQVFQFGRHYELISEEDELWSDLPIGSEEEETEDENTLPAEYLEDGGDLKKEDFTYVCEIMQEYTGRRVLPAEDDENGGFNGQTAYFTTYADDFQELLSYFVLDTFEALVDRLSNENPRIWDSFGRYLGLDPQNRTESVAILDHSDRINYFLTNLIEKLWVDFTETKIEDVLCDTTTLKA